MYGVEDVKLSTEDIRGVIEYLQNNELVEVNTEECYYPTPKGRVFMRLLSQEYYNEIGKKEVEKDGQIHTNIFWKLVSVNPVFSDFMW